jgi:hypothetical protein
MLQQFQHRRPLTLTISLALPFPAQLAAASWSARPAVHAVLLLVVSAGIIVCGARVLQPRRPPSTATAIRSLHDYGRSRGGHVTLFTAANAPSREFVPAARQIF